jgi:hypothetical protein
MKPQALLRRQGLLTRLGIVAILPRTIQVGPKVFRSQEWETRKKRLPRVV